MAKSDSPIELTKRDPRLDIARCMQFARKECGKGLFAQVSDMLSLALGPGKLTPTDYYYYRLYDDSQFSDDAKRVFIGKRVQRKIHLKCSTRTWWALVHDKLVCYAMLAGLGAPTAKTVALYHARRNFADVPVLRDAGALADRLRGDMPYPFFSKPVTGMWSAGAALVESFDATGDCLVFPNGATLAVDDFVGIAGRFADDGYLFQEPLKPHPAVAAVCGERVSTARIMVALGKDGAEILHAIWKIPVGDNVADNFWREGNMLGLVEAESGRVTRVVQGVGPDRREIETHPDTRARIIGIDLPDWDALTSLCLKHAATLSGIRLQAWDIAMCPEGPVVMEVNIGGDVNLPQLAAGAGLLDDRFREFLAGIG
jgi:hypothetical protein